MEIQQLRYFREISREGNFSRAAENLHVTQPTLSQQIKKLEDELGVLFFERGRKEIRLTEDGKAFLPYAEEILSQMENAVLSLQEKKGQLKGMIHLAFIPTVGPYILPKILHRLQKEAPDLEIKLYEETTSVLLDNLKRGKFDLGLLALPIEDSSLVNRFLFEEEFYLAVSKKHDLAHRSFVTLKDIQQHNLLILKEGHCFRNQALDFCFSGKNDSQLIFEGSSLLSVLNLVAGSEGITLVPQMAIESHKNRDLKFIPFQGDIPKRKIGLIWRMSTPLNYLQKYLLKVLEESLNENI